jgi:hypothetical protein
MHKLKIASVAILLCGSVALGLAGCKDRSNDGTSSPSGIGGPSNPQGPSGPPTEEKNDSSRSK